MRVSPAPGSINVGAPYFKAIAVFVGVALGRGVKGRRVKVAVVVGVMVAVAVSVGRLALVAGSVSVGATVGVGGKGVTLGKRVDATAMVGKTVGVAVRAGCKRSQPASAVTRTININQRFIANVPRSISPRQLGGSKSKSITAPGGLNGVTR